MKGQIIALGGGGFSMDDPRLDQYILDQIPGSGRRVCFLPQATAESRDYVTRFYDAFVSYGTQPSWVSLFGLVDPGWRTLLLEQDVIYVGGGNTRSMLALWREWGVDQVLKKACQQGAILAGISAGAICWFEQGVTDSMGELAVLPGLGFLEDGCCPHYDGEENRRPATQRMVEQGDMDSALALDDFAAAHFVDGKLQTIVASRQGAGAYHIHWQDSRVMEEKLDTQLLT